MRPWGQIAFPQDHIYAWRRFIYQRGKGLKLVEGARQSSASCLEMRFLVRPTQKERPQLFATRQRLQRRAFSLREHPLDHAIIVSQRPHALDVNSYVDGACKRA